MAISSRCCSWRIFAGNAPGARLHPCRSRTGVAAPARSSCSASAWFDSAWSRAGWMARGTLIAPTYLARRSGLSAANRQQAYSGENERAAQGGQKFNQTVAHIDYSLT